MHGSRRTLRAPATRSRRQFRCVIGMIRVIPVIRCGTQHVFKVVLAEELYPGATERPRSDELRADGLRQDCSLPAAHHQLDPRPGPRGHHEGTRAKQADWSDRLMIYPPFPADVHGRRPTLPVSRRAHSVADARARHADSQSTVDGWVPSGRLIEHSGSREVLVPHQHPHRHSVRWTRKLSRASKSIAGESGGLR